MSCVEEVMTEYKREGCQEIKHVLLCLLQKADKVNSQVKSEKSTVGFISSVFCAQNKHLQISLMKRSTFRNLLNSVILAVNVTKVSVGSI